MNIREKVVMITGASQGIGLATARLFAQRGAKVALVARSAETLQHIEAEWQAQGLEVRAFPADLRDAEAIRSVVNAIVQTYGRVDLLINNAGQGISGAIADLDSQIYQHVFALNVVGPLLMMQAVIPMMRKIKGGLIINISSMVSAFRLPGNGGYASTKAALNKLSEIARVELAPKNIRLVVVYPGQTTTNFGQHVLGDPAARLAGMGQGQPDGADNPEQVAEKILWAAEQEPEEVYMHEEWLAPVSTLTPLGQE
ncbi:short-chain dehydrogenase [Ktedonobacter sp. SOSP1-85]|uniref:SDR family NAD(P)-dependent oxidoreductase n=1 Tax=Ktedonobacter sp. SOSP1-85 TaxID=2778367 RepID=UPI0019160726|nr:SDR family oxidoreductase [Ktedonobacter sp. SOSP1-85]GHO80633.1 short-chain dehydrogenase [Ktedonobacter sp. SOSP1-85]